jgi:hypothetical protein
MTLPVKVATRLAKLCGLFGSIHDGERAAAARKANELVSKHGLTWKDVVLTNDASKPKTAHKPKKESLSVEAKLAALRASFDTYPDALTDWERDFVVGVGDYAGRYTAKQLDLIDVLVTQLRRHIKEAQP